MSVKVVMKGGSEEITVLGLGPPQINALETGTVEISAQTEGAPTTTQGMSTMEAAGTYNRPPSKDKAVSERNEAIQLCEDWKR